MIVYHKTKSDFLEDVLEGNISDVIHSQYFNKLGRHTSKNEVLSWKNSMMYMNNVLNDDGIPDLAIVSIEFQIPLTSKRIDFIISGLDNEKEEKVIIIELKQWSSATITDKDAIVSTRFQHGEREVAHPSYQAWSYARTIENYSETVQNESITLMPCAYLHNYDADGVIDNTFYNAHIDKAPLFLKKDAKKLRDFIKTHIKYGDSKDVMYRIEHGKIKPSKQLADSLASMLKGNEEFVMIDDQKLVFETAKKLALQATESSKYVLIVEGGPGTGKSVVAINLLVQLTSKGLVSKYISKNAAPRAVYTQKLTGTKKRTEISSLFGGSGAFIDVEENTFDVLIVDEAHRLNLKSGLYGNLGENQALELINASKMAVFFVDDNQQIHIKDIGSKESLKRWAENEGVSVVELELKSQFRCNGSDGFLAWLDNTLSIRETANAKLLKDDFDFRIFDNPSELFEVIKEKNKINNKSRMVAGYCWDWISKKKDPSAYDVVIPKYDFRMKWNLTKDGSTWIIAPESINEIGCIHTCQGLEVDYIGVVIGDDLRVENGEIVTDVLERSSMDMSVRGIKKMLKEDKEKALIMSERIIKNTYRTLMTRGMKGCYVYCTNKELAEYLREKMSL